MKRQSFIPSLKGRTPVRLSIQAVKQLPKTSGCSAQGYLSSDEINPKIPKTKGSITPYTTLTTRVFFLAHFVSNRLENGTK